MNRSQLIIFARAPRICSGKRRLARDVGNRRAFQFYSANLQRLIYELSKGPWQLHVAVASENEKHHPAFRHVSVIVQARGSLGLRMSTVLSQFTGCTRFIVGSDIPDLTRHHVSAAMKALSTHHLVLGPAVDGGFWGIGCSPRYVPGFQFMRGVRWSSSYALADTLDTIKPSTPIAQLTQLSDVDDGCAMRKVGHK